MSEHEGNCPHLAELPEIPSEEELQKLRRNGWKKRRKAKYPTIRITRGRHSKLGWFELKTRGKDYVVKFRFRPRGRTFSALLSDLCDREDLAGQRLRFGWLVADMHQLDGLHLYAAIPGPNEAMRESAPFFKAASEWRRWAIG